MAFLLPHLNSPTCQLPSDHFKLAPAWLIPMVMTAINHRSKFQREDLKKLNKAPLPMPNGLTKRDKYNNNDNQKDVQRTTSKSNH